MGPIFVASIMVCINVHGKVEMQSNKEAFDEISHLNCNFELSIKFAEIQPDIFKL